MRRHKAREEPASKQPTFRLGENAAKVLKAADISLLKALNLSIADNISALLENKLAELDAIHAGFHHAH